MRNWIKEQLEKLKRFGSFLIVFTLLKRPGTNRFHFKELLAAIFIFLGFLQVGQAMRYAAAQAAQRPFFTLLRGASNEEGTTRPLLRWAFQDDGGAPSQKVEAYAHGRRGAKTSSIHYDSKEGMRWRSEEEIQQEKEKSLMSRRRSYDWEWPRQYTQILMCLLGMIGLGVGGAHILYKGNAPSLIRFGNSISLVTLFSWQLFQYLDSPVYGSQGRLIGILMLISSAVIMAYGCSATYKED